MWVSKKRNDKESMMCLTPKPSISFFVNRIQSKEKITEKGPFKKKGEWKIEQKMKAIKKDPTTSIKKNCEDSN